jgi:hypothetical protein
MAGTAPRYQATACSLTTLLDQPVPRVAAHASAHPLEEALPTSD